MNNAAARQIDRAGKVSLIYIKFLCKYFCKDFTKYASQNLQRFYIMKSQYEIQEACGMKSFKIIKEYWRLAILGLAYTAVFAAAVTVVILQL